MPSKQENIKEVFFWITGIFKELNISYYLIGGLAAVAYGSKREVYDIDFDIPLEDFQKLADKVKEYLTFGPANFKDERWDLPMMTISYKEVNMDVTAINQGQFLDEAKNEWIPWRFDKEDIVQHELFGSIEPMVSRDALIKYKSILNRPTDLEDINAITK